MIVLAVIAAVIATNLVVTTARAEAPAHWRPLLMAGPSEVRVAPSVQIGSEEDRRELDAVVAAQSGASRLGDRIRSWTSTPSPVRWNEVLLTVVRDARTNPVRVSRTLALLNAAMYDAIIAACDAKMAFGRSTPADRDPRIKVLAPRDEISSHAAVDAAVAAAAVAVLSHVYPDRSETFEDAAAELEAVLLASGTHAPSDIAAGRAIGIAVGALAIARANGDGASVFWQGEIPDVEGGWQPAKPFRNDQPTEPLAGTWRPWVMTSGSQFRPGPPPAVGSAAWQAEADEVVRVNDELTNDQVRIARFWADGPGTDTPPGHWVRTAITLAARDRLSTPATARMLAHLTIAQADSFIACWDTKFTYWSGRPIGLIPGFASTVVTPNFPSYVSGHSTVSGASSTVLGAFFPADRAWLDSQAEEAAVSRLYGGIHWRSDNEVGLVVGRQVGDLVVKRAFADGDLR